METTKQELALLKESVEKEIRSTNGQMDNALSVMKKAIDAVGLEQKESNALKLRMTNEIKSANAKTEKELRRMKIAVNSLDMERLESTNKDEVEKIRRELSFMKSELRKESALESELSLIKEKIASINIEKMQKISDVELSNVREELNVIRANLMNKTAREEAIKREIGIVKQKVQTRSFRGKGLKKFFEQHFTARKSDGISSTQSVAGIDHSVDNCLDDSALDLISPPSMAHSWEEENNALDLISPPSMSQSWEEEDYPSTSNLVGASVFPQLSSSFEDNDEMLYFGQFASSPQATDVAS